MSSILASHSPIQATLELVRKHRPDPARIVAITNETYTTVTTHFSAKAAETVMAARVSVPYCIAVAAVDGVLGQALAPARLHDPLVRQVLARTECVAAPDLDPLYPRNFPARVTIRMADGTHFTETVLLPKGDPGNPMTPAEVAEKFHANCAGMLPRERAEALLGAIRGLAGAGEVGARHPAARRGIAATEPDPATQALIPALEAARVRPGHGEGAARFPSAPCQAFCRGRA
ncbi:hypothetical protein ACFQU2_27010 [Siccirubricoccus deserti]